MVSNAVSVYRQYPLVMAYGVGFESRREAGSVFTSVGLYVVRARHNLSTDERWCHGMEEISLDLCKESGTRSSERRSQALWSSFEDLR